MLTRRFDIICLTVVLAVGAGILTSTAIADDRSKPSPRILKSASEFDYPPFALVRSDGSADGFSVDLLKAVTQAVGLEINFIIGPWHKIKQKLADGYLDVLPLVSYSQEREKIYDFTVPYLRMHGTIFVRKGEKTIRGRADLKDKEVIVMRGDAAHEYAVRENLSDKLILTTTFEEAMRLLSKGKHDAIIIQQLVGLELIKKLGIANVVNVSTLKETDLKPVDKPLSGFEHKICIAVQDGDKELLALLNEGLAIAIANGTYDELYNKWFSPILPQPPVPLTLILKHLLFIIVPILFLLGIAGLWYLKREVSQKTQSLNEEIKYRKQAGEALQRSEEILGATGRMAKVGGWELDAETLEVRWTEETYRIHEVPVGQTPPLDEAINFYHSEDRPLIEQAIQRALEHGEPYNMEIRFITAKGKHLWTHTVCKPHVVDGKTIKLTGTFQDISERKLVDEALRKSEQKYRQLVQQLQEGIWAIDKDANTTYVNPRMAEMIGYSTDELQGKPMFAFMDERGVEISKHNLERRKQGIKEQHDFELIHRNGQRIHTSMETSPITDDDGNYIGALACVADITDRKRAEEELNRLNLELEERVRMRTEQLEAEIAVRIQAEETLSRNKEMLQMVFDGISDPLLMLNVNLEVRILNVAASEYYLVDQKSVLGKRCYRAFKGRSAPCEGCEIQSAIFNHENKTFERKGFMDSAKTEKVVVYPIEDENDRIVSAIIRISDITQEKTLQRRIVQTEKLSSLGFLVSGVAHEINNPNNFITFNIPILNEYLNEIMPIVDDYAKKHDNLEFCRMSYPEFRNDIFKLVKNIENGSRRIQSAVSNLRGITRVKDKLQMDMIDIQEVIEKCVSICRPKIDILVGSFEVDIPKDLPRIYADSETLELVVINLLINSAQAADKENSWIRLHVSLGDSRQNHLIIEVSDNGCGMDEKTQNHIFEPFFTTKSPNEGTGLGLTLCLNSVKEFGGYIEVDSKQGKGSKFKVILPDKDA